MRKHETKIATLYIANKNIPRSYLSVNNAILMQTREGIKKLKQNFPHYMRIEIYLFRCYEFKQILGFAYIFHDYLIADIIFSELIKT